MDDNQHEHRRDVIQAWQALLDGELDAAEAERIRALIAADDELSRAFASAQAFDSELKTRLKALAPAQAAEPLPAELRTQLAQALDAAEAELRSKRKTSPIAPQALPTASAAASTAKRSTTTRRSIRAQATTPVRGRLYTLLHSPRWHSPWVKAAIVLLALGVGLLAGALWSPWTNPNTPQPDGPGGDTIADSGERDADNVKDGEREGERTYPATPLVQVGNDLPEQTREVLTDLVSRGNDLVLRDGTHDVAQVQAYADQIGFMSKLPPATHYPRWHDIPMYPVNLGQGLIGEKGYEAVCFCTGDISKQLSSAGGGAVSPLDQGVHKRAVLFIFKGNMLGGVEGVDPGTMAVLQDVSHTVICKWDPDMGMTCFLYTPSVVSAVEARELAAPLLDAAHARREDDPEGG